MTIYRQTEGGRAHVVGAPGKDSWIDVRSPGRDELAALEIEYRINPEHLADIMDVDEQSRIEREDEYVLVICRLPVFDQRFEVPYFTVPCGVLIFPDRIVTICGSDNEVLEELSGGRVRNLDLANKSAFLLHLFGRAAIVYLRYLKDINRRTATIEKELQRSVKNYELTQLLNMSKSLVYFTTSIKSNEIVIEKFPTARLIKFGADEADLLEDVMTDNKQAIEMSGIYSDILAGMMDAFASIISNNLNIVMKRLTVISIVLMIPTLVVSMFSMNVPVPLAQKSNAFLYILGISVVSSLLGAFMLRDRPARVTRRHERKLAGAVAGGIVAAHGAAHAAGPVKG